MRKAPWFLNIGKMEVISVDICLDVLRCIQRRRSRVYLVWVKSCPGGVSIASMLIR